MTARRRKRVVGGRRRSGGFPDALQVPEGASALRKIAATGGYPVKSGGPALDAELATPVFGGVGELGKDEDLAREDGVVEELGSDGGNCAQGTERGLDGFLDGVAHDLD